MLKLILTYTHLLINIEFEHGGLIGVVRAPVQG